MKIKDFNIRTDSWGNANPEKRVINSDTVIPPVSDHS